MFEDLRLPENDSNESPVSEQAKKELLKEAKQEILDLRNERDVLERRFSEIYQDARRFAKIIKENVSDDKLKEIEEQEDTLADWNLLDEDDEKPAVTVTSVD